MRTPRKKRYRNAGNANRNPPNNIARVRLRDNVITEIRQRRATTEYSTCSGNHSGNMIVKPTHEVSQDQTSESQYIEDLPNREFVTTRCPQLSFGVAIAILTTQILEKR